MNMQKETRTYGVLERSGHDQAPTKIEGYAAKYKLPSVDLGGFTERIAP